MGAAEAAPASQQPAQIWDCGVPGHRHSGKAEALRCIETRAALGDAAAAVDPARPSAHLDPYGTLDYADPGLQPDGRKRYPIDTETHIRAAWAYISRPANARKYTAEQAAQVRDRIVAAWKTRIDPAGPPAMRLEDVPPDRPAPDTIRRHPIGEKAARTETLRKGMHDVGHAARLILCLNQLADRLATEAALEGDESPEPARLQAIIAELCDFLNALVAEETQELLDGTDLPEAPSPARAAEIIVMASGASGREVAAILRKAGSPRLAAFAERVGDHDSESGGDIAKALVERAVLVKALDEIVPRLDRLAKRVEDIAATPLPPLTLAHGSARGISKREDAGAVPAGPDELAAALARMTGEERTMALIKAAYANPIRPPG